MACAADLEGPDWRDRRQRPRLGPTGLLFVVFTPRPPELMFVEAFFLSALAVTVAEIGDKTQFLAILLAAKFRRPVPIIFGVFCATLLNHAAAAWIGALAGSFLEGRWFQVVVGLAFIAMAGWTLVPDKEDEGPLNRTAGGVFLTTLVAFFLVEIGDKTQIATTLLAAKFEQVGMVAAGTTLGMMVANVPAVLLGETAAKIVPLKIVRAAAAGIFAVIGVLVLISAAR